MKTYMLREFGTLLQQESICGKSVSNDLPVSCLMKYAPQAISTSPRLRRTGHAWLALGRVVWYVAEDSSHWKTTYNNQGIDICGDSDLNAP